MVKMASSSSSSKSLSVQDKRDLEKYTRFLALKSVQIIVQSRLGEKVKTKSKPHSSGADWVYTIEFGERENGAVKPLFCRYQFNLSIKDLPEVMSECRKAFSDQIPSVGLGMCVEISLKTVEGDTMVLETWHLEMIENSETPSVRVRYTVYNRMSLLLKSLIAVTRVTPAYKLSTCQGPDSFVVCYRLFMGEPQWSSLGDCYERVRVGRVDTPNGALALSVAYRTQLTITPHKVVPTRDCMFMVKSDHFMPDTSGAASPKWIPRPASHHFTFQNDHIHKSVVEEIAAACEDCREIHPIRLQPSQSPAKFSSTRERKLHKTNSKDCCDPLPNSAWDKQASFGDSKKVGAFATDSGRKGGKGEPNDVTEYFIPDAPFSNLLLPPPQPTFTVNDANTDNFVNCNAAVSPNNFPNNNFIVNQTKNNNANVVTNGHSHSCVSEELARSSDAESHKSCSSVASGPEDFVLVELKPPFACAEGTTDLGTFFRECQSAPPLLSFSDQPSLADQVNELGQQLATFETNQLEFDEFVDFLCHSETSK